MNKLEYRGIKRLNYRHVGKYTPRKGAKDIVTGKAILLDGFSVPHMLCGKIKRSPYPHTRILSIDISRTEALPGVWVVITYKNMSEQRGLGLPVHKLLMEDKVYYIGDLVVLIVADTVGSTEGAIGLIDVEYEQLEAAYTAKDALKEGAVEIYSRFKGNHVDNGVKYFQPDGLRWQIIRGDVEKGFEEAAYVAEDKVAFDKMPSPLAPETPSCIAKYEGGNEYTIWAPSQSSYIPKLMGEGRTPNSNLNAKTFNMGGSYDNKQSLATTVSSATMLSLVTKQPVKIVLTKAEQLMACEVCLGNTIIAKVGVDREGYVKAVEGDWLVDTGVIVDPIQGQVGVGLGEAQLICVKCPNWYMDSHIAMTNKQTAGIVHGYGGQEPNSRLECLIRAVTKKGSFDPLDVSKKNYIAPGDRFIWRDGRWRQSRPSLLFLEAMQNTVNRFGWAGKWKGWDVSTRVNGTKTRGVGMGVTGNTDIGGDNTEATVRIIPDLVGSHRASMAIIECDITESDMGIRSNACKTMVEVLNVPVEKVPIAEPGSKFNSSNYGLCGSRGTVTTGKVVSLVAMEAKKKALELDALYFKRSVDQLDTKDFMVHVWDNPRLAMPMFKLAPKEPSIVGYGKHMEMFSIPSCMVIFVEAEVDLETSNIKLVKVAGGTDIEQIINSKVVETQLHGRFGSACIDTTIFEKYILDPSTERLLTSSLADYKWRTLSEFPPYDAYIMEPQVDSLMFKVLGIGEISGVTGANAVLMAIFNAIGVDIKDYLAIPAVMLKALGKAQEGRIHCEIFRA